MITRHLKGEKRRTGRTVLAAAAFIAFGAGTGFAQDLVYTPVNPSFGGNPLNSTHLLNIASAQRAATARDANSNDPLLSGDDNPAQTDADLFIRQLESRLLSALASQVTEAIFGDDPQTSGQVVFGTTTIDFDNTGSAITLTITDSLDGTVTVISVPQLVVS